MKQRVIYVMTHDSIGLGEDGPTHQPVEHIWRRCAPCRTSMCSARATASRRRSAGNWRWPQPTPSILALSRQAVPNLRTDGDERNLSAKGAYVMKDPGKTRDVTLIATGSEVGLAVEAAEALGKDGIKAAVVSMPSFELFAAQSEAYEMAVLGDAPRVAIEAGVAQCWHQWLRKKDRFVGLSGLWRLGARRQALRSISA